ncbi:cell division cycle-related protein res2/pct1 [Rhypophila sp. PSN 637]
MAKGESREGVYSATYSGIPVYEYQFGVDLKEHIMRRRQDDWINATHILKAAGFDKPARTRILEREVQKDEHEKIQGGYGKYQGTWIPLKQGEALAMRNGVYDKIRAIFEFTPGPESPPPAPRHTSKPKAPKAKPPAVPNNWGSKSNKQNNAVQASSFSQAHHKGAPPPPPPVIPEEYDNGDAHMHEDDTPDNATVASASYMAEDDRYDVSQYSTGHRKRKREEQMIQGLTEQQHAMYGDELLDYFLLNRQSDRAAFCPDPPTNFQPDWPIDTDGHTALHWACAMGDVDVIKQLKRFGADLASRNVRGETPFMRAVFFTNCYEKQTFPMVMKELFSTVDARDNNGSTVIHHAAVMQNGRLTSHSCSRYYLDIILNKLQETHNPDFVQDLLDAQDHNGDTAIHLAARRDARKCIRALLGRGASTDIPNNAGVRAEDLIKELNASKSKSMRGAGPARSSSPFAPDSQRHSGFRDAIAQESSNNKLAVSFKSEAANTVHSRITPLVVEKFHDLAQSFDAEYKEKDDAEKEARQILQNTQNDLANLQATVADLESRLEADEAAAKTEFEAEEVRKKVVAYVTHQNRLAVQQAVQHEISMFMNGDDKSQNQQSQDDNSYENRHKLAMQLHHILQEQRSAEAEYVEARGMIGTGEKIDKYRHLLKSCLPPEDQEALDENLEDMIQMMQDEADVSDNAGPIGGPNGEPMEITPV